MLPERHPGYGRQRERNQHEGKKSVELGYRDEQNQPDHRTGSGEQQENTVAVEQRHRVQAVPREGRGRKRPALCPVACPVFIRQHSVDPYGGDSFSRTDWVAESGCIFDGLRVEEHQVGVTAFTDSGRVRPI